MKGKEKQHGQQEKKIDIRPYTRQFYRGNTGRLTLAGLETAVDVAGQLYISWLMKQLIDLMGGQPIAYTLGDMAWYCVGCVLVFVVAYILTYHCRPAFITRAMAQYREYVFQELTRKNISAFSKENSSLYISALSNDANTIETGYLTNLFVIANQALLFVGALVMMFWYSPLLTVICIGLTLLPLVAALLTGNLAAAAEKEVSDRNAAYLSTLKDSLAGFSVVKSFQAEGPIRNIFHQHVQQLKEAQCRKRKCVILVQMWGTLAGITTQIGVFLVGAWLAMAGKGVTVGMVVAFVQMMNYVINPIATIPTCLAECKAAKELIRKIAGLLPENVREVGLENHSGLVHGIHVKDLSFSYEPEKTVLQDVDVTFDVGKSYALVGASGSGKSTLLNLLMAAHTDYEGAICYDETELRKISSESLYEMVSVVQQNVFIFNASIRDNITMFMEFPEKEVDRAIELSGLSQLIAERGEDYLCGENGSGLSGGEKQRISIARSLLRRSQVLLVDEATAALDAQTAFQVSNAILDLDELTRIVITHDLDGSLLKRYDQILTLKNGRIAETGTFEELMERKGYFYSLYTVSQ